MKDYYYILGLQETATESDIKTAYRKLSIKFHPDKNDGDEFFKARFQDIQEAYATLSDSGARKQYDGQRLLVKSQSGLQEFAPEIVEFYPDNLEFHMNDDVVVHWKTVNANLVEIEGYGQVLPVGSITLNVTALDEKFVLTLKASNTILNQSITDDIEFTNLTYAEIYQKIRADIETEVREEIKRTASPLNGLSLFLMAVVALLIAWIWLV